MSFWDHRARVARRNSRHAPCARSASARRARADAYPRADGEAVVRGPLGAARAPGRRFALRLNIAARSPTSRQTRRCAQRLAAGRVARARPRPPYAPSRHGTTPPCPGGRPPARRRPSGCLPFGRGGDPRVTPRRALAEWRRARGRRPPQVSGHAGVDGTARARAPRPFGSPPARVPLGSTRREE